MTHIDVNNVSQSSDVLICNVTEHMLLVFPLTVSQSAILISVILVSQSAILISVILSGGKEGYEDLLLLGPSKELSIGRVNSRSEGVTQLRNQCAL